MNKYKKPDFNKEILGLNPYSTSLEIPVNKIPFKGSYRKVGDTFEQITERVEYDPSCKMYTNPHKRKLMAGMKDRSKSLLLWIMYEIDPNEDYLWINRKRYMEEIGVSSINTYKAAVNELVRYCFIGLTVVPGVYWINPDHFFNGSRIKKYPKSVIIKNE